MSRTTLLLLSLIAVGACGGDGGTDDTTGDVTDTDTPVDAKWHPAASAIARYNLLR